MTVFINNILLQLLVASVSSDNILTFPFSVLVINGEPADIKEFTYLATLFNKDSMCSASIISRRVLLTAAHCFEHNLNTDLMYVVVGRTNVEPQYINYYDPLDVCHVVVHERFNKTGLFANDIALVLLSDKIIFNEQIQKAHLPTNDDFAYDYTKNSFTVAGFGWTTYPHGKPSTQLMKAQMSLVSMNYCERVHNMKFTKDIFCLYGDGGRDTCRGDSGGGVVHNGYVVGIVSFGDGCGLKNKPSMYINVYYFRNWIKNALKHLYKTFCNGYDGL